MKVAVRFTLDVDAEAWSHEFDIPPFEVREDVRAYFETAAKAQLRDVLGLQKDPAEGDGR